MGNAPPKNKTGKQVIAQKLENAKKLGILSLSEHSLNEIPKEVFSPDLKKLRIIDLSKNNLQSLGPINVLSELKSLNLESNDLHAGGVGPISSLEKLQNLSLNNNKLGLKHASTDPADNPLPELPPSIKHIHLSNNMLLKVPRAICSPSLTKLEKLDLSRNSLVVIPSELCSLPSLVELNLDHNKIASLPANIGNLKLLKALSLRNNQLRVTSTHFTNKHPQPLPKSLFTNTLLIDLNLHGNSLTNTQMNDFEGFQEFLDRRQKVKSKTLTNLDVCGLD